MFGSTVPPKKADLPTSQAAEKIENILCDETALDGGLQAESEPVSEDDNASIGTDASSDSYFDCERKWFAVSILETSTDPKLDIYSHSCNLKRRRTRGISGFTHHL
jgi:hypothetical protein